MNEDSLNKLVVTILRRSKKAREDNMQCIKLVHQNQIKRLGKTKQDYFSLFWRGKLSASHIIYRSWRLMQQKYPELRGENWGLRQMKGAMITKDELIKPKFQQQNLFHGSSIYN